MLLLELPLVVAAPDAVDAPPAGVVVVVSCGAHAVSMVPRLMSVPPVSIDRRFSALGVMGGPPHRCSA